jgi:hypothetical protein
MRLTIALGVVFLLSACGSGSGTGTTGPRLIAVGGDYTLSVALAFNDCGNVVVQPLPTHVDHAPGAASFLLTHGPNTFNGTLAGDGAFTTETRTLPDGTGSTLTMAIAGRFSTGGLEAQAAVTLPSRPCRYEVRWTGVKQGTPNMIP